MKKFLSILIPTRNRSRYLGYAIQSALNLNSNDIEILVSENHSVDNTKAILAKFSDTRLRIFSPKKPLAMHENWDYLLSKAQGEWVYFLGDDDAIMPHAVDHLRKVVSSYPRVEAIVSPRAYYFWDGVEADFGGSQVSCSFSKKEVWRDSKKMFIRCLNGEIEYLNLPQIYSGGFQRITLINRIKRAQGGLYFKSANPDAHSALVAVLHTFKYLEIGVPLAWVGTSPSLQSKYKGNLTSNELKDRTKDFFGLIAEDSLRLNYALGEFENFTFTLCFYESCTTLLSNFNYDLISQKTLKRIFYDFCYKKTKTGEADAISRLASELGFKVPSLLTMDYVFFKFKREINIWFYKFGNLLPATLKRLGLIEANEFVAPPSMKFENILSFDPLLAEMYTKHCNRCT